MNKSSFLGRFWKIFALDLWLLIGLLAITGYGLLVLYSASGGSEKMFTNRVIQVCLGLGVMFVMAMFPPRFYEKVSPCLYVVCIILLILVDVAGEISKGAQRWLNLGFIRFQPSEIAKLSVPLMVASYLGNRSLPPNLRDTSIALAIIIAPTLLVAMQPDLGTSILVCAAGLFVLFLAGLSWKLIGAGIVFLAGFIPIMWFYLMHDYQKTRVMTLIDPDKDPLGTGYHIIQSKIAIGSGGIEGKGWMEGTQSQLDFLPEPHTDFIFAVLSEEFGLIGVLVLLAIYLFIIARGLMIGAKSASAFGRILSGGTALLLFVYVFVNIGMVSGILPVVGVPLPLFSYGGTSYVTLMAAFGLMMSSYVHRERKEKSNPYKLAEK
ncbi:rod shape-determining protein RodA [Glaesserella parasuis]|uniref:Peptidoglycan glycosyltransferase MrdB n=3 Tax=Glaesserella parasuis TaxID=738 RepID=A0A6I5WQ09_GLAPU|nr:rod shape-determining protein RodA [Glaesserella parasuis]AGO15377.1 rod-shape-determining protein RodA [Glaesserella parasuis ZJ0906]AIK90858.1 cell wall shape-determining protein [Glaesserella parasuis]ATW44826.1 rod shape-determining protein RodA [Glaesserella parasuis str. Nagasaki]AWY44897.1 rod shape-determining protein RodA [Glaesserella parasuis 29755]EMY46839.1 rod-shape-determining protein RodA [Glaesserella parasuis gx033]